ncbi:unnamed protein product [Phytophthora fragariaefolia]|uniref:Unnamed protein product n=1 Tax=Phytophthora fragariaefolia TaxID=1490495 RepID=A0A9W6WY60_9STRA|nr:unnamed protein product [Phytophthora fragariaefolia]
MAKAEGPLQIHVIARRTCEPWAPSTTKPSFCICAVAVVASRRPAARTSAADQPATRRPSEQWIHAEPFPETSQEFDQMIEIVSLALNITGSMRGFTAAQLNVKANL